LKQLFFQLAVYNEFCISEAARTQLLLFTASDEFKNLDNRFDQD
jgi:hypothetical protein